MTFVSDMIFAFRRRFLDLEESGVTLTREQLKEFNRELKDMAMKAQAMENTQSRLLWNEAARADLRRLSEQGDAVVAEASRPGSNVHLLAPPARPFDDGRVP